MTACGASPLEPDENLQSKTDTLVWEFINSVNAQIDLRFFDRTYGATYPSTTAYYALDSGADQTYRIKCNKNATICFGASVHANLDLSWGVSVFGDLNPGNQSACHACDGSRLTAISLSSR